MLTNWQKKKVAVLGLGVEGKDVVHYLLPRGAELTVYDQKDDLAVPAGVRSFLGPAYLQAGLSGYDYIFRSPAFRPTLPAIAAAEKAGTVITSATKLFFDLCPGKIIGVTGTKGKGTTATLIYEILQAAGRRVFLAGNIGQPMLALLPRLTEESWVVLELSSFQLMDLEKSPTVAVVLFITSEHLDYHRSVAEYVRAKSNLVRFQREDDLAVLNGDNETAKSFQELTRGRVVFFSRNRKTNGGYVESGRIFYRGEVVGETKDLQLRGEHNWDNVTAAVTVTREIGVETTVIKRAMVGFKGLEHRLERVRKVGGVTFYNDSFSTTPETTMAAIRAFREPIILIAGGSDKGSDYREMAKEIGRGSVRVLILIGRMAEKIREAVEKEGFAGEVIFRPDSMREAVMLASRRAREGEVVILSPACASFDMFENYKERGKEFKKSVEAL